MKLEEIPNSTKEVKKFSNGNMLLTLWFNDSHCKSMEVVFDMLSGTSILFCRIKATTTMLKMKSLHELPMASTVKDSKNKIETLKV